MLENHGVGNVVAPVNIKNCTETALGKMLKQLEMMEVGGQDAESYRSIVRMTYLTFVLAVPHTLVQLTKYFGYFASLFSISLLILVSDEMVHPK